jgi:hypothetical protein
MSSKKWIDESGLEIPENRVTKTEKLRERKASQLAKEARKVHAGLVALQKMFEQYSEEVYLATMAENGVSINDRKGNFTWYSFDRNIRIEVSIQEYIDFDHILISAAKQLFDEFLNDATEGIDEWVQSMIIDVFSTSSGRLDPKKVMNVIRNRKRLPANKYPNFHKAVDLVEKSIQRNRSKTYHRIAIRNSQGQYDNIPLNIQYLNETHYRAEQQAALPALQA